MTPTQSMVPVERGEHALQAGDWAAARRSFEEALDQEATAEAHQGLGRALWWLQDTAGSIRHHQLSYRAYRRRGEFGEASLVALWLSREYMSAYGNGAASSGWYSRAEQLSEDMPDSAIHGWLALARAEKGSHPEEMFSQARLALDLARRFKDPDLEILAMAALGYTAVAAGDVGAGMAWVDESMVAALAGEPNRLETIGEVFCKAVAACELAADWRRIQQWASVVEAWIAQNNHIPLLGFCDSCCAEMFIASGAWEKAETMLTRAMNTLRGEGHLGRCAHPAAKLAELRVVQGRVEEAELLLSGFEHFPEAVRPLALLHLARGEANAASTLLNRRLDRIGRDNLLAAPFLTLLAEVQLVLGEVDEARSTTKHLRTLADETSEPRLAAEASMAAGRLAVTTEAPEAVKQLEDAVTGFAEMGMLFEAAKARLLLAEVSEADDPETAVAEARIALAEFDRAGAPRHADAASALLRRHGVRGRTGPKELALLTRREREVLDLLAVGLTNAEIADRLFLSTKTVGHYVSSILAKLGLRNRSEAAALVLRTAQ